MYRILIFVVAVTAYLGKIVRFLQQDGEVVEKDKPYVEVEAMKMIMALKVCNSCQTLYEGFFFIMQKLLCAYGTVPHDFSYHL